MNILPQVPCQTCGNPTVYTGTQLCNRCWEVERNLVDYLKIPNGRLKVLKLLGTIDVAPLKRWIGKERARFERIGKSEHAGLASKERAFGEANVCSLILSKINADLRKLKA